MAAYTEAVGKPYYEWGDNSGEKEEFLAGAYYTWTDHDEKERLGDDELWLYGVKENKLSKDARRGSLEFMTYKAQGPDWAAVFPETVRAVDDQGREVEITSGSHIYYRDTDYEYARYGAYSFEAQPDAKALTVTFSRYGETAAFRVPLAGEEAGS